MRKSTRQPRGKARPSSIEDEKVFSVRALVDLNDLAKLEGRLMRAFLANEISAERFRTAMLGCRTMTATMQAMPPVKNANPFGLPMETTLFGAITVGCGNHPNESIEEYNQHVSRQREKEVK